MMLPGLALGAFLLAPMAAPAGLDAAMAEFWKAKDAKQAAKSAKAVEATGADFDAVYERLKAGRPYAAAVERGTLRWVGTVGGGPQEAAFVEVPGDYDPSRRYPVRVFLHGGVGRPLAQEDEQLPALRRRLESAAPLISVLPAGWNEAEWWFQNQVENLAALLDRLKRGYNVDENRVHLMGVSDGGTGAYFFGMRSASAWSALFAFNGSLLVLANPGSHADGELYASNLAGSRIYAVNGGRDPLYPIATVAPYLALFERAGAAVTFHPKPDAGHDTSWWPQEQPQVDAYVAQHPRDPLPDRLSWRTERVDRYNRLHWLVIDALAKTGRARDTLPDPNTLEDVQFARRGKGQRADQAFPRSRPSGRVDVVRSGNAVEARAAGVASFTLLLSPDEFDFGAPIRVVVDGKTAFEGRVERSLTTLLEWAARDNDRTALYAAALRISVP